MSEDTVTEDAPTEAPRKRGRILNVGPFTTTGETAAGKIVTGADDWVRRQLGLAEDEATRKANEKARADADQATRKADGARALPDAQAKADEADQARRDAHDALAEAVADNPITAAYLQYLEAERRAQHARAEVSSAQDLASFGYSRGLGNFTPKYPSLTDALDQLAAASPRTSLR